MKLIRLSIVVIGAFQNQMKDLHSSRWVNVDEMNLKCAKDRSRRMFHPEMGVGIEAGRRQRLLIRSREADDCLPM